MFDLYSKRLKKAQGDQQDVFVYDRIPEKLRVQIVHIWRDAIGPVSEYNNAAKSVYKELNDALCREYGRFRLSDDNMHTPQEAVGIYFLRVKDGVEVLDVIELSFRCIDIITRGWEFQRDGRPRMTADEAIEELNARFLEHGVGYQYESGQLIRKDSEFLHVEAVKPALAFLSDKMYKGANEEFLSAHKRYRAGEQKECLTDCLKTLESVLKSICDKRKWKYDPRATANTLLEICFKNFLVPDYLQSHFSSLRSTLESGVPTLRNKSTASHGQGSQPVSVPPYYAGYALHLTASAILLLAQAERDLR